MKSLFRLAVLTSALIIAGCSSITPMEMPSNSPSTIDKAREAVAISDGWNTPAVLTEGNTSIVLMTPFDLPSDIKNRRLQLTLEPGASVNDVVAILGEMGVPIIISDEQAASKAFYLPRFNGTLGTLLKAITRATDVWFTWQDGSVLATSTERIAVSVPQDNTFSDVLVKGLESLGVKSHAVTWQAGMATLDVTPSQFSKVRQYLSRMTKNSAFVTLQVAVVNVTLNQNVKQGIDWEKLQLSALKGGTPKQFNSAKQDYSPQQNIGGTNGMSYDGQGGFGNSGGYQAPSNSAEGSSPSASGSKVSDLIGTAAQLAVSGTGLEGLIFGSRFSFSGMFNYLQTYGDAETKQNVILKTVAGNPVEFKSLTQIPYVSEIGVTSNSGYYNGSNGSNSSLGSSQTDKADDGIEVKMTPTYDAAANTVTVDLALSIKAVVAFNELSAGNQIGKMTQPTTAERSFTDILRMRPGQTVVVGGLTYDSISNNNGSPLFLQGTSLESQSLKLDRQSMFIVVRSSVVRIGQLEEEGFEEQDDSYLELANPDVKKAQLKGE